VPSTRGSAPATSPFDDLAHDYDLGFSSSPLGEVLREAVWRSVEPHLQRGGRVLELGCGTGVDALRLAEAGFEVVAVDASERMVAVARRRCGEHPAVSVVHGDVAALSSIAGTTGPFDLVLSDFGALNCVEDLRGVLQAVERRLAYDGVMIAVVMGRFVPWEWLWMTLSGRPRSAVRRLRPSGAQWRGLRIRYETPRSIRRCARDAGLDVRRIAALGALLPITEAGPWFARRRGWLGALNRLERRFETKPPLPWLADHLIVEMGRS
jgi:SAM-dependent methyltransferase